MANDEVHGVRFLIAGGWDLVLDMLVFLFSSTPLHLNLPLMNVQISCGSDSGRADYVSLFSVTMAKCKIPYVHVCYFFFFTLFAARHCYSAPYK